jgi:undecaprenyl-diphosphatase
MDIPTWLQAVVLGIVQGLTEFIPISSSGHLVLVPYLLGWERPGLAFDVALHMGTVGAILLYFRAELLAMARGILLPGRSPDGALYRRIFGLLVIGSIPVAVAGLLLEDVVAEAFESPLAACGFLLLTAAILLGGERLRDRRVAATGTQGGATASPGGAAEGEEVPRPVWDGDWVGGAPGTAEVEPATDLTLPVGHDAEDPAGLTLDRIGVRQALLVGTGQMLALFPGVSRSGSTIMAGVAAGLTREAATRFSFLLALPALIGAGLLSLGDLREPGLYSTTDIAMGVVASFVAGYLAIRFLVALVSRERLTGFAWYVVAVAIIGAVGYAMIGPPGVA